MSEDVIVWSCNTCGQRRMSVRMSGIRIISDGDPSDCRHNNAGRLNPNVELHLVLFTWDER